MKGLVACMLLVLSINKVGTTGLDDAAWEEEDALGLDATAI